MAVKRARAGFREADKPVASSFLWGPTGVGKTELSRQLASNLGIPLVRFDMSEYQRSILSPAL
jgi:ATP-dependent Clp protease ATP-binding subunit ClpA